MNSPAPISSNKTPSAAESLSNAASVCTCPSEIQTLDSFEADKLTVNLYSELGGLVERCRQATGTTVLSNVSILRQPGVHDLAVQLLQTFAQMPILPDPMRITIQEAIATRNLKLLLLLVREISSFCSPGIRYDRITDEHVRLLVLLPGQKGDHLDCRLEVHARGRAPAYEALSYTWGAPRPKFPITCDGASVEITSNLHDALRCLQFQDRPRIIWTDQLCIWQADTTEKNSQVRQMDAIYRDATRVIMWVGKSVDKETTVQAGLLAGLCGLISSTSVELLNSEQMLALEHENRLAKLPLRLGDDSPWTALLEFLELPYFQRSWIIQEIFMARAHLCLWGGTEVKWEDVLLSLELLGNRRDIVFNRRGELWAKIAHVWSLGRKDKSSLLELLKTNRYRITTDSRDRIFSLLSMTERTPALIRLDYRCSPQEIYQMAARQIIADTDRADFLAHSASHSKEMLGARGPWPSWVPIWMESEFDTGYAFLPSADGGESFCTVFTNECPAELVTRGIVKGAIGYVVDEAVRASKGVEPGQWALQNAALSLGRFWHGLIGEEHKIQHKNALQLAKELLEFYMCCDNVAVAVFGLLQWQPTLLLLAAVWIIDGALMSVNDMVPAGDEAGLDHVSGALDLACTVLLLYDEPSQQMPTHDIKALTEYVRAAQENGTSEAIDRRIAACMKQLDAQRSSRNLDMDRIERLIRHAITMSYHQRTMEENADLAASLYINMIHNVLAYKRLPGLTSEGGLCIGPPLMQVSDLVAIVFGCNKPLLLRRCLEDDSKYRIVGECFVPGIMEGEFIEQLRREGTWEDRVEEFCLV